MQLVAACIRSGVGLLMVAGLLCGQAEPPPSPRPAPKAEQRSPLDRRLHELLDRFHRAMPLEPIQLRDAAVRTRVAPDALPVLRELQALLAGHDDPAQARRAREFTVYALVLADEPTSRGIGERSKAGDASAQLLADCAAAITAVDGPARARAVAAVGKGLQAKVGAADTAVQCLLTAADLSAAEASALAGVAADHELAGRLAAAAKELANDPRRLLGQPIELRGALADGTPFSTASLRGKVVLVDFWATWCGPCVRALPKLVALHEKFGDQGLAIVGVSSDRELASLQKFCAEHPEMAWPQLFDRKADGWHELNVRFGVRAIPRVFVIDRQGVLRCVEAPEDLEALIARLLAG